MSACNFTFPSRLMRKMNGTYVSVFVVASCRSTLPIHPHVCVHCFTLVPASHVLISFLPCLRIVQATVYFEIEFSSASWSDSWFSAKSSFEIDLTPFSWIHTHNSEVDGLIINRQWYISGDTWGFQRCKNLTTNCENIRLCCLFYGFFALDYTVINDRNLV